MRVGVRSLPIEYYILDQRGADRGNGPIIGYLQGKPIAASVVDREGHRYSYAGVAPRLRDGRFDIDALRPGEWIAEPGLVYRSDENLTRRAGK